jgi:hypothetical protein
MFPSPSLAPNIPLTRDVVKKSQSILLPLYERLDFTPDRTSIIILIL